MSERSGDVPGEAPASRRLRPPTVTDVARAAGVAPSTVSRAFTNPNRVNEATRQHVLAIAQELGYRGGHPAARTLLRGSSETIALLVPDITNPHFFGLIRGAERQAASSGFTLVLADTEESPQAELRHVERLGRSVDGIVFGASRLSDDQLRAVAAAHPIALVNRQVDGLPSVNADQRDSVWQIVSHLVGLGHRRIAYLSGPRTSWVAAKRWDALITAANHFAINVARLGPFPPFLSGGAQAADAFLARQATAAITHNGLLGIGVLRRLAERGITVPEDVSVIACDDIFAAEFFTPALTARVGPMEDLGRAAVNLVLCSLEDDSPDEASHSLVLPAQLVVRGSTGPVRLKPLGIGSRGATLQGNE
ncbi:HTH-type transcriptional repressor CytR [Rhodococcus erythropolis]|uniref:LacI family DNA-binding transcriptional regulator n=1 Tax=Rhodococcus erythropolis TaxID=1833 RepID=UPI000BB33652|nr:LacI family DNA-binding transcriptional regulator [Rhodococcus erythropolis]PBI88810.1 HTH-type transcriptional repressor CytR [Rhodococcus erythropolis]